MRDVHWTKVSKANSISLMLRRQSMRNYLLNVGQTRPHKSHYGRSTTPTLCVKLEVKYNCYGNGTLTHENGVAFYVER